MKLRRQQQIERELNGYRAWIDKAGKAWGAAGIGGRPGGLREVCPHRRQAPPQLFTLDASTHRGSLYQSRETL